MSDELSKLNTDSDYTIWKKKLHLYLCSKGLHSVLNEVDEKQKQKDEYIQKDAKAKYIIINSVNSKYVSRIIDCETTKDVLIILDKIFLGHLVTQRCHLLQEFYNYKFEKQDLLEDIGDLMNIVSSIKCTGMDLGEIEVISKILCSLPKEMSYFRTAWESTGVTEKTLTNLTGRLQLEIKMNRNKEKTNESENKFDTYLTVKSCFNCGRKGHIEKFCRNRNIENKSIICYKCLKNGHKHTECKQQFNCMYCKMNTHYSKFCLEKPQSSVSHLTQLDNNETIEFILDSGASSHIINSEVFLHMKEKCAYRISTADGNTHLIDTLGKVICKSNSSLHDITFNDVLLVPKLKKNLISISKITNNNCKIVFFRKQCHIYKDDGTCLLTGELRCDGLFYVELSTTRSSTNTMLRHCDEDSGRSSCSAASICLSPVMDYQIDEDLNHVKRRHTKSHEANTNTELKVSVRPRSLVGLLKSPDERDPFPSCRIPRNYRKPVFNLFDTPRRGGLSNAHSTLEIACSTQIEEPIMQTNTVSMTSIALNDNMTKPAQLTTNFRRGKPVQRAASRLYKAECGFKGKEGCIGPEFIVRASQPARHMDLTLSAVSEKRVITVVLLNGQKVEVMCDPNVITAGQLFEALVRSEKYDHNFMLGIAILIGGDFAFLPDDYKIKKVAPDAWHKTNSKKRISEDDATLTVFLRIKFFLPKNIASNIQDGEWRYRVYLQLRRATLEGQLTSTIQNLILLAGYALHIEFGEFSFREHGTADYFLLEHYLPETVITNDMADFKLRMKRAHESRRGLDRDRAIINYISLAQTFRDYGAHFYSAIWATRDGFCRDVWLSIGPRGITLYSRNNHATDNTGTHTNRIVLQSLPWHHIHTFYYNKKSLYIMPNSYSGLSKIGVKYKLKMVDNKSYFTFWLASLHHRLYLKLYAKDDFLTYLSDEFNCPSNVAGSPKKYDCSNYQDSYNLAVRNPIRVRRPTRRRFKVDIFGERKVQNKENEKPNTEELLRQILSPVPNDEIASNTSIIQGHENSSNDGLSSSESSIPRRQGVKMGTRVFHGMKSVTNSRYPTSPARTSNPCSRSEGDLAMTQSDSDDLSTEQRQHCIINSMQLLPERHYNQSLTSAPTAYVLESPKVYPDVFNYNVANESCLNTSLFEKLDNMECVQGERIFVTAPLERDDMNALGLQVAEGSDGNVYIKSITPGSPADLSKKLLPGDQIISVNGKTLLNVKYDKALLMLQSAPHRVELIVLQNAIKPSQLDYQHSIESQFADSNCNNIGQKCNSVASALDVEITDDELLNEEALKTIYALIKLTKDKVISRMKDRSSKQTTPNKSNLQKCFSENKVYEESDLGNYSSQENTPQKRNSQKFNTWRGQLTNNRSKRRPLSLSIPTDVDLPDDYLNDNSDDLLKKSSLKSIQSSLNSLDKSVKSSSSKSVALPRNFGFSRRWLGPVRYPVTPCKNSNVETEPSAIVNENVTRRHFVYGAGDSDEDQIFL